MSARLFPLVLLGALATLGAGAAQVAPAAAMSAAPAPSPTPSPASAPPATADPLAEVTRRLDDAAVQRGEFEQTKTLKGFRKPLVSRGSYLMVRGKGLQWTTREPFASTLVVTRERLLTLAGEGADATREVVDTQREPGLAAVNDMLLAMLAGNLQALAARFRIERLPATAAGWQLALLPRDAALARVVARIEIAGDRQVQEVRLSEANGDGSRIRFSPRPGTPPSAAEAARFD